ncbi:hypothetical protein EXN66_Car010266 [Channa argus]|uniref:THAP-type domain-containing protein n=1 Tax=Channa argus TaxID=215402 RepID=A0A6G1PW93_CHAAH|nr:hypothetical protein EXN66_Car010266 [Channa argus]KAK2905795.1 hypothetical protein Q8A73_009738 [Channa argus]
MAKATGGKKHKRCYVVGCREEHKSLHLPPFSDGTRAKWLDFIFDGKVPDSMVKYLFVCANHFASDCFSNLGQYNAGLAGKLLLVEGSIPTLRGKAAENESASASGKASFFTHVACQTDPLATHATGTQLSLRTLQPHFRSRGTQTTESYNDVVDGSSCAAKTPAKKARLELEQEEDISLDGSSPIEVTDPWDSTHDPADPVTVLSESQDATMEASLQVNKTPTYNVNEDCLLELFQFCPVCQRASDVWTRRSGTFISVEQKCRHCQLSRRWNSQPFLGSTPAENTQPPAAVSVNGISFLKLEKVQYRNVTL